MQKLRVAGADDFYITYHGVYSITDLSEKKEADNGGVLIEGSDPAMALIMFRASDLLSREKMEAKIDEAMAGVDEYAAFVESRFDGKVSAADIKEHAQHILEAIREKTDALQETGRKIAKLKDVSPVSDAELSAFEASISDPAVCPSALKVLANAQHVHFVAVHDLKQVVPAWFTNTDFFHVETDFGFAGARVDVAHVARMPHLASEYMMKTLCHLLENDPAVESLCTSKGASISNEFLTHPNNSSRSKEQKATLDIPTVLGYMQHLLNGPEAGVRKKWRRELPQCAAFYDQFIAIADERAKAIDPTYQPSRPEPTLIGGDTSRPRYTVTFNGDVSDARKHKINEAFIRLPAPLRNAIGFSQPAYEFNKDTRFHHFSPDYGKIVIKSDPQETIAQTMNPVVGYGLYRALRKDVGKIEDELLEQAVQEHIEWNIAKTSPPNDNTRVYEKAWGKLSYGQKVSAILGTTYFRLEKGEVSLEGSACKAIYDRFYVAAEAKIQAAGVARDQLAEALDQVGNEPVPPLKYRRDEKYGGDDKVTQQDIDIFREGYDKWDGWVKAFIKMNDITFVMGRDQPVNGKTRIYDTKRNEVEIDVAETSQSEWRLDRQHPTMFGALLCGMDKHMPAKLDWDSARRELTTVARAQGNTLKHISEGSILTTVHRNIIHGDRDDFERLCPKSVKLYDRFMEAAKARTLEMRKESSVQHKEPTAEQRKAWAEKYQASEKAFAINTENGALTAPQQEYFKKLNEVIDILGVSPKEFDNQFRLEERRQFIVSNFYAGSTLLWSDSNKIRKDIILKQDAGERQKFYDDHGKPQAWPRPHKQGRLPDMAEPGEFNNETVLYIHQSEVNASLPLVDAAFGIWKFDLPEGAWAQDRKLHARPFYNSENAKAAAAGEAMDKVTLPASTNVLQRYAGAASSCDGLTKIRRERVYENGKIIFPTFADCFLAGVQEATVNIVGRKMAAQEMTQSQAIQLSTKLAEISVLWPEVMKSRKELADVEQVKTVVKSVPYELATDQAQAAQADGPLHREIQAACGKLDCRYLTELALGSVMFGDPIIRVANAYHHYRQAPADQKDEAAQNLSALLADDMTKLDLQAVRKTWQEATTDTMANPMQVRAHRKHRDQLLASMRSDCPILFACLNGDIERKLEVDVKPIAYMPEVKFPGNASEAVKDEVNALCAAMDCKLGRHEQLGKTLFTGAMAGLVAAVSGNAPGNIKAALEPSKNKGITQSLAVAKEQVLHLLSLQESDVAPQEWQRHQRLRDMLLQSPVILACITGNIKHIADAQLYATADDKRLFVELDLLPVLNPPPPEVPNPEKEAAEKAAAERASAEQAAADRAAAEQAAAEQAAALTAAAALAAAAEQAAAAKAVAEKPVPKVDMRKEAYDAAWDKIFFSRDLVNAHVADGYNAFKCELGYFQRGGFPIKMTLANEDGKKIPLIEEDYVEEYRKRGLQITLSDAIELKIALQSEILANPDIEPIRHINGGGSRTVEHDNAMPLKAHDHTIRKIKVNGSGGILRLNIKAPDRKKEMISATIDLGVADTFANRLTDEEENWIQHKRSDPPANLSETAKRVKHVTDFIELYASERKWVTKREVVDSLRERFKDWTHPESMTLDGFVESQVLHVVTDALGKPLQTVTLTSATLSHVPEEGNPTWMLTFSIRVTDPQDATKTVHFKGKGLNLHTDDADLAIARAKQSLLGSRLPTGESVSPGLIEMVQNHTREHPHDLWTSDGHGNNTKIGDAHFNFMLDMLRYEHDVKIQLSDLADRDGKTHFTMTAWRANKQDTAKTAAASPQEIKYTSADESLTPLQIKVALPTIVPHAKVRTFVEAVSDSVAVTLDDCYIARDISHGAPKYAQEYKLQTVVNTFVGAVEAEIIDKFKITRPATVITSSPRMREKNGNGSSNGVPGPEKYRVTPRPDAIRPVGNGWSERINNNDTGMDLP